MFSIKLFIDLRREQQFCNDIFISTIYFSIQTISFFECIIEYRMSCSREISHSQFISQKILNLVMRSQEIDDERCDLNDNQRFI